MQPSCNLHDVLHPLGQLIEANSVPKKGKAYTSVGFRYRCGEGSKVLAGVMVSSKQVVG